MECREAGWGSLDTGKLNMERTFRLVMSRTTYRKTRRLIDKMLTDDGPSLDFVPHGRLSLGRIETLSDVFNAAIRRQRGAFIFVTAREASTLQAVLAWGFRHEMDLPRSARALKHHAEWALGLD